MGAQRRTVDGLRRRRGRALAAVPRLRTGEAVEAFLRAAVARGLRPKTIAWYRTILGALARRYDPLPPAPEPLEAFLADLGDVSDVTRVDYWVALRVFYRWAAGRLGVQDAMGAVAKPRRRRKVPGSLDQAGVRRLMASALSRRDKALLTLLLDTGIRLGEAYSLTWEGVGEEVILVDGKTGPREVPISTWARWVLLGVELPWRGRQGELTRDGIAQAVRRCLRRAGIARGGPHLLRHTFARLYLRAGGDAFSLQRILGHRDLATTRIYVELELGDLVERHRKYSPIVQLLEAAAAGADAGAVGGSGEVTPTG